LALVKVVVKVVGKVCDEKTQEVHEVEESKELELFPADKFWLLFMWCYSKFLEGLAPIPVRVSSIASPLRKSGIMVKMLTDTGDSVESRSDGYPCCIKYH
jgi:hypothetical protein